MVTIKGMITSMTHKEGTNERTGKSWEFNKIVFWEDGKSEPIEIEVPANFQFVEREPVELNIELSKKGFDIKATLA